MLPCLVADCGRELTRPRDPADFLRNACADANRTPVRWIQVTLSPQRESTNHHYLNYMRTLLVLTLALAVGGCSSLSNTEKGGAIGAAAGAAIGGLIGKKSADKPVTGVIVGAAVGGTVGAIIGRQMDKQAEELEAQLEGAEVERVGEGILVTFDSAILFRLNSDELSDASKTQLAGLANSLKEFEGTEIVVAGHTDSSGTEEYNLALSERRAQSAAMYLLDRGVTADRISTVAYGESQPIASNETAAGRVENRRVEVAIYATDEYREKLSAEAGNEGR